MKNRMKLVYGLAALMMLNVTQGVSAEDNSFSVDYENFQESTLVDDENCLFKITGAEQGETLLWNVQLENRTETELMFSMRNVSVNGYMCDPYWSVAVPSGETVDEQVEWWSETLLQNGIEHAEQVSFEFQVYDNESWEELSRTEYVVECACPEEPRGCDAPEEGVVLVDNENVYVIANGIYIDDSWGEYCCDVYIENRTDLNVYVSLEDVCVNGVECDPYWGEDLKGGTKMFSTFKWYPETLEEYGISDFYQVDGYVRAYCSDDWEMDDLAREPFAIYPYGEEGVQEQPRITFENEKVLVDNEACTFVIGEFVQDEYSYRARLCLENKTESRAMFALDSVTVDGMECDPYWADSVPAGKIGYSEISWYLDEFQTLGIDTPSSIEGMLRVYDDEEYDNEYFNGTIVLQGEGTGASIAEPETEIQTETEPSPYDEEAFKAEVEAEFRALVEDPSSLENASEFVYAIVSCMCGDADEITADDAYAPIVEYLEKQGYDLSVSARNYMEELGISRRECVKLKAALGRK